MANVKGLTQRKGVWQYRLSVPKGMGSDIWVSLKTTNLHDAIAKLPAARKLAKDKLSERQCGDRPATRSVPSSSDIKSLADAHYVAVIDQDTVARASLFTQATAAEVRFYEGRIVQLPDTPYYEMLVSDAASLSECLSYYWWHHHGERIDQLEVAVSAGDYRTVGASSPVLGKALIRAEIDALTAIRKDDDSKYRALVTVAATVPAAPQTPLISVALEEWVASQPAGNWTRDREAACRSAINLLIEVIGDKPLSSLGRSDVKALKDVLVKLPANRHKLKQTRGKPVTTIIALGLKPLGLKPMSVSNANKQLNILAAFLQWAEDIYDGVPAALFSGKTWKKRTRQRDEKDSFSIDELARIFEAPVFTGCDSELHWKAKGGMVLRGTSKFWLPILALYTGARSGELCKVRRCDVKSTGVCTYLDINEDVIDGIDSRVKTDASVRCVPLHSDVVAMGFLDFVASREQDQRLFPELKANRNGKLSDAWGKYFHRFLKSIGIKRPKLDFHSFRHTWVDGCTNSAVSSDAILAVKGDARPATLAIYGNGKTAVDVLAPEMAKLKFSGLCLDHLKP